jgi:hypothetical protein
MINTKINYEAGTTEKKKTTERIGQSSGSMNFF